MPLLRELCVSWQQILVLKWRISHEALRAKGPIWAVSFVVVVATAPGPAQIEVTAAATSHQSPSPPKGSVYGGEDFLRQNVVFQGVFIEYLAVEVRKLGVHWVIPVSVHDVFEQLVALAGIEVCPQGPALHGWPMRIRSIATWGCKVSNLGVAARQL